MSLTLEIPAEIEAHLRAVAAAKNLTIEEFFHLVIEEELKRPRLEALQELSDLSQHLDLEQNEK